MKNFLPFLIVRKEWVVFISCIFIFLLLLFKDPFSQRTLIPNFEPYPDTLFYIVPALNLIKGHGFYVSREGRTLKNIIPPLYSLAILPFFVLEHDPRMVYFANVFLSLISASLFFIILKRVTNSIWVIGISFFLYVTNYFLYWMPTLAMAENLLLPLYLLAIYILISKINSRINFALLGLISMCIYATKSASVPLSLSILVFSLIKIILFRQGKIWKLKALMSLFIGFSSILIPYALFLYSRNGHNIFSPLLSYFGLITKAITPVADREVSSSRWISLSYAEGNLPLYLSSLLGNSQRFLWDSTPLVPKYIAVISLMGFLVGFITKQYRYLSLVLIAMVGSTIAFLLTFYSFDARYIYIAIPSLLIGFSVLISSIARISSKINYQTLVKGGILIFFILYLLTNIVRIKSQISLNLKYAETPWYYISVLKLNEFFTSDKVINGKKPVVISALPPFFVDFYSNGNYTLLPLSYDQEYRYEKEAVWGPNDYSDLSKLYTEYILKGYDVYVSRYGLGNEIYTNRDFNTIISKFNTTLILSGCYEQCNIYRVTLKK